VATATTDTTQTPGTVSTSDVIAARHRRDQARSAKRYDEPIDDFSRLDAGDRSRTVIGGTRWQSLAQIGIQVIRLVVTLVLARLLTRADFGIVAYALTFVMFVDTFKDMGAIPAIIQTKRITQRLLSTLWYVNMALGAGCGAFFLVLSPILVHQSDSTESPWVLAPMGLVLLASSAGIVHRGLLRRRLQFKRVAVVNILPTVVFGVVSIVLASMGWGASAIVVGQVVGNVTATAVGFFLTRWWPRLVFDWQEFKSVAGIAGNMSAFGIFNFLFQNADKVLVGTYFGADSLGVYSIGQRVLMYPVRAMTTTIQQVLYPTFSRMRDDDAAIGRGFLRACAAISLVTFPMMIGVTALAEPFVVVVLGEKWRPAIPIIAVLAPIGLLHSLQYTVGAIYQAKDRFSELMWWGLASGVGTLVAYVVGMPWGIQGMVWSYAVAVILLTYPTFAIPFRFIGLRFRDLAAAVLPTLLASGGMGLVVWLYRMYVEAHGGSDVFVLLTGTLLGVAVYGGALLVLRPPAVAEFLRFSGLTGVARRWDHIARVPSTP
jgi:PST family polysaccharide transporter